MSMQPAVSASLYTVGGEGRSGPRPRTSGDQPANNVVSLLEAVDVRIAAGLRTLGEHASARDPLGQARELIASTLRRAQVLALSALREPAATSRTPTFCSGGLPPRKSRQLIEYIELRLTERLSISELASIVGLSRSYFCRAFRETFDASPRQYIEARRLQRAQQMIIETDQSLLQIALDCGFSDAAHFSKTFHAAVGLSPSRWRRMYRD